ncbi:uncharacterized protein LOC135923877 [Gordionus sp. m RMFG-2023]|uniref:uncharacterized protein LOC135923877 n=1 Tax=Gordionus sp. m RMFG-2023 TaxID=3053472 RepID=UPI0031FE1508
MFSRLFTTNLIFGIIIFCKTPAIYTYLISNDDGNVNQDPVEADVSINTLTSLGAQGERNSPTDKKSQVRVQPSLETSIEIGQTQIETIASTNSLEPSTAKGRTLYYITTQASATSS